MPGQALPATWLLAKRLSVSRSTVLGANCVRRRVAGLAFGYGLIDEARIKEGVARLAAVLPGAHRASRATKQSGEK